MPDTASTVLFRSFPANRSGRDFVVGDIHGCFDAVRDIVLFGIPWLAFLWPATCELRRVNLEGKESLAKWLESASKDRQAVVHLWFRECAHITRDQAAFLKLCPTAAGVRARTRRRDSEAANRAVSRARRDAAAMAALCGEATFTPDRAERVQ